jgi:hypothetical protein
MHLLHKAKTSYIMKRREYVARQSYVLYESIDQFLLLPVPAGFVAVDSDYSKSLLNTQFSVSDYC